MLLGIGGLVGAMAGGLIAYFAPRFPAHIEALETAAGFLVIGGFSLATCALPTLF
jgi:hypothetical protein